MKKRRIFKSGSAKTKGLLTVVVSLIFALALSACSVVAVDKPITGSLSSETAAKNAAGELAIVSSKVFDYTGAAQSFAFEAGKGYMIELWGAQGGSFAPNGGAGGYTRGYYNPTANITNYIFVGGAGGSTGAAGWNGGGAGKMSGSTGGGGGGATDIRISNTAITTAMTDAADPRFLVAGGGGGSDGDKNVNNGTNISVEIGGDGGGLTGEIGFTTWEKVWGGVSTVGGSGGSQTAGGAAGVSGSTPTYGVAGVRGVGGQSNTSNGGGGGGGGWFGGGGGSATSGGGGSSFARASMIEGTVLQQGVNVGNGKAVIHTLGTPFNNESYAFTINGSATDNSSGKIQTQALSTGKWQIEVWGAAGGILYCGGRVTLGGRGGYAKGFYDITTDNTLANVFVGKRGTSAREYKQTFAFNAYIPVAYNGGGQGSSWTYQNASSTGPSGAGACYSGAGGGGATDVRINSANPTVALTDSWSSNLNRRIIVGGAGGGGDIDNGAPVGGAGGGLTGSRVTGTGGTAAYGGAQTAGGAGAGPDAAFNGSEGKGGKGNVGDAAGGGAGLFGGGGGNGTQSGAGGSSYCGTANATLTSLGYIPGVTDGVTYGGGENVSTGNGVVNRGNSGHGFAIITKLTPKIITTGMGNEATGTAGATLNRLANNTISAANIGTEYNGTVLSFVSGSTVYTESNLTSVADIGYIEASTTTTTITLNPKVSLVTTRFYAYMQDSNGIKMFVPFTISTNNESMIMNH